ncbi:type VI secretion system protein TssA [Pseudomonas taiwanensis]|uniref:type VI secretion system protein TssA n=1 Tax=Pseudomonas taiwanensis TaxID=470150 RepID=UPI0015B819D3|nr:type VI secretion system protein TssA [Pseudomonas taiwanensis]NWL80857.1 type VI secretion system protein TssA [Pseudomonas taiwanensis]
MNLPITDAPTSELLEPISDSHPCGPSLRYDPAWDRLKELRREDDASLPSGVWQADLKRGDWAAVERLASELLRERSKDLMLAAWLGEAWLLRSGLDGLTPALGLLAGLCERYPEELHPQPEDGDRSWRVAPLEWMVRRYSEIVLTRCALFGAEHADLAHLTLHGWQQLQQRQVQASDSKADKVAAEAARLEQRKLDETLRQMPPASFLRVRQGAEASLAELRRLDTWSDGWLGDLAPSFAPLQQLLNLIHSLMQEFAPMQSQTPPAVEPATETVATPVATAAEAAPNFSGTPGNREEAYRQLALIADYLARTEPHSPVPYVIRRAVEWGNQPLSNLLEELITADAESRRLWKLLGVLK